jgi:hypothetical protein
LICLTILTVAIFVKIVMSVRIATTGALCKCLIIAIAAIILTVRAVIALATLNEFPASGTMTIIAMEAMVTVIPSGGLVNVCPSLLYSAAIAAIE